MRGASLQQLSDRLAEGKFFPAVLLLGSDSYLRDRCQQALVESYVESGARPWAVSRLSCRGGGFEAVLQNARTVPMLCPRQVVMASDVEALEKLGEDGRKRAVELLREFLDDPAPSTVLVLCASSLDERMSLFKLLKEKTFVVSVELDAGAPDAEAEAANIAVTLARQRGVRMEPEVARLLAEIVNAQPALVASEVEKLATYAGEAGEITREDIERLVVSEKKYSVWRLTEILAEYKPEQAMVFLDSLIREGEEPPAIIGALAWMFRKLLVARELPPGLNGWQAARQLQMRPESAEQAIRDSRRLPRERLLDGLSALAEADNRLKLGNADERAVLEFLAVRLGGRES